MKKFVIISDFNTHNPNRGSQALSYGSIPFLVGKGYLSKNQELINYWFVKAFWKSRYKTRIESYKVGTDEWTRKVVYIPFFEKFLFDKFNVLLPFTKLRRIVRNTSLVAAINGGDGFADIYSKSDFLGHIYDSLWAIKNNIPVVILPQTLGPFKDNYTFELAKEVLTSAKEVFVRDNKFVNELDKMGVKYELTEDLSAFMQPEPWDIDIKPGSIGVNVSGLCYDNKYGNLSGQFAAYPELIDRIITHFQRKGKTVYLIPHSYCYGNPEPNNDDIVACEKAYNRLLDKTNVVFVNQDLPSPRVKYVISKMSFFIGTRMHANFAAIYTHVPLFGLAYSYKFAGAFNANGLNGEEQTAMVNNIQESDIDLIIDKIERFYAKQNA